MATHTYANPMVAVILGWLLAHEASTTRVVLASVAILGAIVLIRRGEREATVKPPGAVPTVAEIRTSEECAQESGECWFAGSQDPGRPL